MKIEDSNRLRGVVRITQTDAQTGEILSEETINNRVVLSGRNLVRDLLAGETSDTLTHLAVGTVGTPTAGSNTALGNEVFRDSFTATDTTTAGVLVISQFIAGFQANGNTLREAGLFTAGSGGKMYARVTFPDIPKSASIAVTIEWSLYFEAVTA